MAAPMATQYTARQCQQEARLSSHRCLSHGGLELVGGVVKAGWWAHHRDIGLQWPYLPLHFPLPAHLFLKVVNIWCCAWGAKQKS